MARYTRAKIAKRTISELKEHPDNVLLIHYSCESFVDRPNGRTPRITSIAIKDLRTGQTHSFSIHKIAEIKRIAFGEIQSKYDPLEEAMLSEYYEFVRAHLDSKWVHWNMRDINYGFEALDHRYRVLGGQPTAIPEERKYDLAKLLIEAYGVGYIGHPRLERLIDKNDITKLHFLNGKQEADAFDRQDYVLLHLSTLRKVDIFANIIGRIADNILRHNSKWYEIYGISLTSIGEFIRDHWIFAVLALLGSIASILGVYSLFK
jgi:hypothetical protein